MWVFVRVWGGEVRKAGGSGPFAGLQAVHCKYGGVGSKCLSRYPYPVDCDVASTVIQSLYKAGWSPHK